MLELTKSTKKKYSVTQFHATGINKNKSRINANVYKFEDRGGWYISGNCWKPGTFDPQFSYGPYNTKEEALKELESL